MLAVALVWSDGARPSGLSWGQRAQLHLAPARRRCIHGSLSTGISFSLGLARIAWRVRQGRRVDSDWLAIL